MFRNKANAAAALFLAVSLLANRGGSAQEAAPAPSAGRPTVATKLGQLEGVMDDGVRVFRGIPFAAPPVGPLRWQSPQPAAAWKGVRDASKFGPNCPSPAGVGRNSGKAEKSIHGPGYDVWFAKMDKGGSEDCLTLNVWAPDPVPSALRRRSGQASSRASIGACFWWCLACSLRCTGCGSRTGRFSESCSF